MCNIEFICLPPSPHPVGIISKNAYFLIKTVNNFCLYFDIIKSRLVPYRNSSFKTLFESTELIKFDFYVITYRVRNYQSL